jgi:hypothetical protein
MTKEREDNEELKQKNAIEPNETPETRKSIVWFDPGPAEG